MKAKNLSPLFLSLTLACTGQLQAAISYASIGTPYTQDFDTLLTSGAGWMNDTTINGWSWASNSASPTTYVLRDGSAGAQNLILSLGTTGQPDRAFGGQSPQTGTDIIRYGAQFLNNTGQGLTSFTLGYTGETWRYFPGESTDGLDFEYQVFTTGTGSLTAVTGWTGVAALDYTSIVDPGTSSSGTPVNGNLAANRSVNSGVTVPGLTWGAGQTLWIRWSDDLGSSTIRSMMGVDDVTFTAVPEPSAALLCALGILPFLRRKR